MDKRQIIGRQKEYGYIWTDRLINIRVESYTAGYPMVAEYPADKVPNFK